MNNVNSFEIELLRNNYVESKHKIFITTNKDEVGFDFFPRSAIKPFQIVPLLALANKNNIKFDTNEIAIFGSSHSGQDMHLKLLKKISEKYEINWREIFCAPQRPMHIKTADNYISQKLPFSKLHNNCSGKHLSMLIYSKLLKADNNNYESIEHVVQKNINKFFKEIFEIKEIHYGIDGCGLPAIYLNSKSFLKGVENILLSEYKDIWLSIFNSYNMHPDYVGGDNRTDTNIMINSFNPLLAKSGAEGVLFATDNEKSYLFKCLDGNFRAVDLVATYELSKQKIVNEIPHKKLVDNYSRNLQNTEVYSFNIT